MYKLCWRLKYFVGSFFPTLGDLWDDSWFAFAEAHHKTKSDMLADAAADMGVEYVDIPMKHCSADDLKGILFMDELPSADKDMQAAAQRKAELNAEIDHYINKLVEQAGVDAKWWQHAVAEHEEIHEQVVKATEPEVIKLKDAAKKVRKRKK